MIGYPINKELVPTIARVSEGTWPRLCKKITFSDLFDEKRVLYFENTQESYGIRAPGAFLEWGLTSHQPVSQRISAFFHGLQRGAYSYFTVIWCILFILDKATSNVETAGKNPSWR
jgi:hypothetical protein